MRRTLPWASSLALWLANVAVLVSLYGLLPHRVAMHWDLLGRPDGWGSPAVALGSLAIAGLAVAVVALLAQRDALRRRGGGTPWTTLPCDAVQGLLLGAVMWGGFRVVVDRCGVHLRIGPLGIPIRNLSWQDIRAVRLREFSPLAEFGGWGLRYRPGTTALFLRGRRGAEIVLASGRSWLVGSDHPERLCEVLESARKAQER